MTEENTLPEGWSPEVDGTLEWIFEHPEHGCFIVKDYDQGIHIARALSAPSIEDAKAAIRTRFFLEHTSAPDASYELGFEDGLKSALAAIDDISPTPALDLTQNLIQWDLLTDDVREAFRALPKEALEYWNAGKWLPVVVSRWVDHTVYRQNPDWTAEPLTKPDVPWDVLVDWVQWVVRDPSGEFFGFETMPVAGINNWIKTSDCVFISSSIIKFDPGTCDWRDSLVMRPKEST